MRLAIVAVLVVLGCGGEAGPGPSYVRALVTDRLTFQAERTKVRAMFDSSDWCRHRTWDLSDEFATCDPHPYADNKSSPTRTIVRYDASQRTTGVADLVPVGCRMYGKCDAMLNDAGLRERDFVDHHAGLRTGLAAIGRRAEHSDDPLPSMQRRTVDAVAVELTTRYGPPMWTDVEHYGAVWLTATEEIGVFIIEGGTWVIETHEPRTSGPPGLTGT